jgi:putative hemolysin
MTSLEAVADLLDVPFPVDEYDTLSGFLIGQLGYILSEDENPEISWGGLVFKVESIQDKRIATVTVTKNDEEI